MPRVKEFFLDDEGRAVEILWDNGKTEKIPFRVDESLTDHHGDREDYWIYLNGEVDRYAQTISRLRPGEPNPMDPQYPGGEYDSRYQSELRMWENKTVNMDVQEEMIRRHTPPPRQTPPTPPKTLHQTQHDAEQPQAEQDASP